MFNMFDPIAIETYFGKEKINPYLQSDYKAHLSKNENFISNPSMMTGCIDVFLGTPIQSETGKLTESLIVGMNDTRSVT